LTKNKIFNQLSFLEFYADSEFKIWKFDRAWKTGLRAHYNNYITSTLI